MKRIFLFIIVVVSVCIFFVIYNRTRYENSNIIFTDEFFSDVESAYITMYALDPFDEVKGEKLGKLCQKLSAVKLEEKEDSMYFRDGEQLYGGPYKLVFTYKNGDYVALEVRDSMFCFTDSPQEKNIPLNVTYEVLDVNIQEQILSCFVLDRK